MKNNVDRLGYYLVGWKKFHNKTLALLESNITGYEVKWIFNDSVYKSIDWTIPVISTLLELYQQRAEQLRSKYDYLVLYYSGGADSINILHAFIDNDIFLDEIVMQLPEPSRQQFSATDTSNRNLYAEIEFAAIPHLNKVKNKLHPNTKVRYQDFAKPVLDLLEHDDWFDTNPMGTNICISGIGRSTAQVTEKHILNLCNSGKLVGQVLGVDKPLIYFDGVDYYAYFSDVSAMHAPPVNASQSEIFHKHYHTEFFYWTPDLPEIVVKQAQEIKKHYQFNVQARELARQALVTHISAYKAILHPIIYPSYVKVEFETEKPSSKIVRPMDEWFWKTASAKIIGNYTAVIDYLKQNTNLKYMIDHDISNGIAAHLSHFYKI